MRSISGVRGLVGKDLIPEVVARYAAAFGQLVRDDATAVVVARDSRTSGAMFADAVTAGLTSVGTAVIKCGLIPTPTAQLAVEHHHAAGGIIITASHNPVEWNALKFVGADGLFLDRERVDQLFALVDTGRIERASWDGIGGSTSDPGAVERHLDAVLALPYVDVDRVRARHFTVVLDCVRGAGGTIMPALLERLGGEVFAGACRSLRFDFKFLIRFVVPACLVLVMRERLADYGLGLGDVKRGLKLSGLCVALYVPCFLLLPHKLLSRYICLLHSNTFRHLSLLNSSLFSN